MLDLFFTVARKKTWRPLLIVSRVKVILATLPSAGATARTRRFCWVTNPKFHTQNHTIPA
jgi:hypothetical protein